MNMAPLPPRIKGWCPSALRPMETGDGFLVRLRFTGGQVSTAQCAAIAHAARTYGNGLIDLTQRGNLQLRGVKAETLPAITAALYDLDLLDSRTDALWSVIGSPLAGIDPTATIDGYKLVQALETKLAAASDLAPLPDKFCFLVDEGGRLGLDGVGADIRLVGFENRVVVALNDYHNTPIAVAVLDLDPAAEAVVALARAFLKLSETTGARRMGPLVDAIGVEQIAHVAGLKHDVSIPALPRRMTNLREMIGLHEGLVGAAAPFGRLHADQFDRLAGLAPNGLRLTPWRSILLPGALPEALSRLKDAGFIVEAEDPRLAIAACPGQPACTAAQIDTHPAAEVFAPLIDGASQQAIMIHISGCEKGCAHAAPAPLTIVGQEGGYDLIFNGRANAKPAMRGLDLAGVRAAIEAQIGKIKVRKTQVGKKQQA